MGIMDTLFFTYNTVVIGIALVACSVSLVVWFMTHRRDCVLAASGFGIYAFEVSLVFLDEYTKSKATYDELFLTPYAHPWIGWVANVAMTVCLWAWMMTRVHAGASRRRIVIVGLVYGAISLALLPAFGAPTATRQWFYWMWRDLALVGCFLFGYWYYRRRATKPQQLDLEHSKTFFITAFLLSLMVMAEDTFMLLIMRPSTETPEVLMFLWYLSKRNMSENILMLLAAFYQLRMWRGLLSVYARHPRTEDVVEGPAAVPEQAFADRLALFGEDKGLSKRELEVLEQVLRGVDMQGIANELFISPGTVKAHLHRIYKKSGVAKREDLVEAFWRS